MHTQHHRGPWTADQATTANIYILILKKYVRTTVFDGWQGIYCIEENDWSDSLHYKHLHRIVPSAKMATLP